MLSNFHLIVIALGKYRFIREIFTFFTIVKYL